VVSALFFIDKFYGFSGPCIFTPVSLVVFLDAPFDVLR